MKDEYDRRATIVLLWLIAMVVIAFSGCAPSPHRPTGDYRDVIACEAALLCLDETPAPPTPTPEYACPRCKDTGKIIHGDGHSTTCPDCQGAMPQGILGISDATKAVTKAANAYERLLADARRAGKIQVEIKMPPRSSVSSLPGERLGIIWPPPPILEQIDDNTASNACGGGQCPIARPAASRPVQPTYRRRLFWRWRR